MSIVSTPHGKLYHGLFRSPIVARKRSFEGDVQQLEKEISVLEKQRPLKQHVRLSIKKRYEHIAWLQQKEKPVEKDDLKRPATHISAEIFNLTHSLRNLTVGDLENNPNVISEVNALAAVCKVIVNTGK